MRADLEGWLGIVEITVEQGIKLEPPRGFVKGKLNTERGHSLLGTGVADGRNGHDN